MQLHMFILNEGNWLHISKREKKQTFLHQVQHRSGQIEDYKNNKWAILTM